MPLRDPTPEELKQALDSGQIDNTQVVGFFTRLLAKNLSANPEQAMGFLQRQGFEVKQVADEDKMQFLVRKPGDTKWGVLDPQGFDLQDLTDIASDLLSGTVTGFFAAGGALGGAALAAPTGPGAIAGGILGGVAGGGVGAGGYEAIRQGVGGLLGVNEQPDVGEAQRQAFSGQATYPLGGVINKVGGKIVKGGLRAAKKVTKTGSNIVRNLLGRVAGVSEEEFAAATKSPAVAKSIINESAPRTLQVLDKIREFKNSVRLPEYDQAKKMLKGARPVSLGSMFRILEQRGAKPIGDERAGIEAARQIALDIAEVAGVKPQEFIVNTPTGQRIEKDIWGMLSKVHVSADIAEDIKQRLQKQIDFSGKPGEKLRNELLKRAQGNIRASIIKSMPDSASRDRYSKLMKAASDKMDVLNKVDKKIGEWKAGGSENVLRTLFREGKSEDRRLFDALDKKFGQKFMDEIQLSSVAGKFAKDAPPLTATGRFLGASALGTVGSGVGAAAGGVPGAVLGGGAGFAAGFAGASPKGTVKLGRGLNVTENAIRRMIGRTGEEVTRIGPYAEQAGFAAAGLGSRAPESQPPEQFSIDVQGSDEDISRAKSTVDRINAIPGLTPQQKFDAFQKEFGPQQETQP